MQTKERTRLTSKLMELVVGAFEAIIDSVEEGTEVYVDGYWLAVVNRRSNVGSADFMGISEDRDYGYWELFDNGVYPGDSYFLHNDFGASIQTPRRELWIWAANNIDKIVAAFEANEQEVIESLRSGIESLERYAK